MLNRGTGLANLSAMHSVIWRNALTRRSHQSQNSGLASQGNEKPGSFWGSNVTRITNSSSPIKIWPWLIRMSTLDTERIWTKFFSRRPWASSLLHSFSLPPKATFSSQSLRAYLTSSSSLSSWLLKLPIISWSLLRFCSWIDSYSKHQASILVFRFHSSVSLIHLLFHSFRLHHRFFLMGSMLRTFISISESKKSVTQKIKSKTMQRIK